MGLAHGTIGWADVAAPDTAVAEAFYTEVFGWETTPGSSDESMPYTMFTKDGSVVAGMGPLTGEQQAAGQPPTWSAYGMWDISDALPDQTPAHWLTWFRVSDVDAVASKVEALGGSVMNPPGDSPMGMTAILTDPAGAVFAVIDSVRSDGQPVR
jgi:hypothetical protein